MNVGFLTDLLQTVAERGRDVIGRAWPQGSSASGAVRDVRQFRSTCDTLLSRRGEASGVALAASILAGYRDFDVDERMKALDALEDAYWPDTEALLAAANAYQANASAETLSSLQRAAESRRQELIRRLNLAPDGTAALVKMREDLLRFDAGAERWPGLDADFRHLFMSWFNRGFLVMRRISWRTPADILDRIIRYEAVHEIHDWSDLRRRIEPDDRRLFGFFHPQLVDDPLIFVEVALTARAPVSIGEVLAEDRDMIAAADATTAVFYSISNCQEGLRGISFGHFLIKQVAEDLKRELPNLDNFVTLSPAPGFATWLAGAAEADQSLAQAAAEGAWRTDSAEADALAPALIAAGARYLAQAKRVDGRPLDPVARFHLGNGAILDRINWPADPSDGALRSAFGLMVNYRYDLSAIELNREAYAEKSEVIMSSAVRKLLTRKATRPLKPAKSADAAAASEQAA